MLWRPEFAPTTVLLAEAPGCFPKSLPVGSGVFDPALARHSGEDGSHLILPVDHRLWLLDQCRNKPLAAVIPLDDDFLLRMASTIRFWRSIKGKTAGPQPRAQRLTTRHRKRLVEMLRAIDADMSGATYREIASALFGSETTKEIGWKTHPVRARTIRLVRDAISMMNQGYLKLLRGR